MRLSIIAIRHIYSSQNGKVCINDCDDRIGFRILTSSCRIENDRDGEGTTSPLGDRYRKGMKHASHDSLDSHTTCLRWQLRRRHVG